MIRLWHHSRHLGEDLRVQFFRFTAGAAGGAGTASKVFRFTEDFDAERMQTKLFMSAYSRQGLSAQVLFMEARDCSAEQLVSRTYPVEKSYTRAALFHTDYPDDAWRPVICVGSSRTTKPKSQRAAISSFSNLPVFKSYATSYLFQTRQAEHFFPSFVRNVSLRSFCVEVRPIQDMDLRRRLEDCSACVKIRKALTVQ